jgi:hypothetical protein
VTLAVLGHTSREVETALVPQEDVDEDDVGRNASS